MQTKVYSVQKKKKNKYYAIVYYIGNSFPFMKFLSNRNGIVAKKEKEEKKGRKGNDWSESSAVSSRLGKPDEKEKKNREMAITQHEDKRVKLTSLSGLDEEKQENDHKSKRAYQLNG